MPFPRLKYVLPKMFAAFKRQSKEFVPDPKSVNGIAGTVNGEAAIDLLAVIKMVMYKHPVGPNCFELYRRVLSIEIRRCESLRRVKVREEEAKAWIKAVNK